MSELTTLDIRNIHWKQTYVIPNINWTLSGYSRAAYRTGFYIKEIDLMLDAGPQNFNLPSHILIGHTHIDHIASLPLTMINDTNNTHIFNIYSPSESELFIKNFIESSFLVNNCNTFENEFIKKMYNYYPVIPNNNYTFIVKGNELNIQVLKTDHTIPSVGYGITLIKNKLKPEYLSITNKKIFGELKNSGIEITNKIEYKSLAYLCDTSINALTLNKNIFDYSTIIIECTFLLMEHKEKANKTKHINWFDLKPYIQNNPNNHFILIHFSLQYKDQEIKSFFDKELENISNVKIWI